MVGRMACNSSLMAAAMWPSWPFGGRAKPVCRCTAVFQLLETIEDGRTRIFDAAIAAVPPSFWDCRHRRRIWPVTWTPLGLSGRWGRVVSATAPASARPAPIGCVCTGNPFASYRPKALTSEVQRQRAVQRTHLRILSVKTMYKHMRVHHRENAGEIF